MMRFIRKLNLALLLGHPLYYSPTCFGRSCDRQLKRCRLRYTSLPPHTVQRISY